MKLDFKVKGAFICVILAALCWIIGDVYLVGFTVDPLDYTLFTDDYVDVLDPTLATLMLEGTTERLMFGTLIACFSTILFVPGVWLVYQAFLDKQKWYAFATYSLLLFSVLLMPLGHAVFFYTGEIHKAIYHLDKSTHSYLIQVAQGFTQLHVIAWSTAMVVILLAWFVYSICVFLGKTRLPRWMGGFTPTFIVIYQYIILSMFDSSPWVSYLGAAVFNSAYLIFFVVLIFLLSQAKQDVGSKGLSINLFKTQGYTR